MGKKKISKALKRQVKRKGKMKLPEVETVTHTSEVVTGVVTPEIDGSVGLPEQTGGLEQC
jgi:hypothetical protein